MNNGQGKRQVISRFCAEEKAKRALLQEVACRNRRLVNNPVAPFLFSSRISGTGK